MVAQLLAVALGLLLFLPTLADATPIDQTWIPGFYDDADYDDVVVLVAATPSPPPTAFVRCPDPHRRPIWLIAAATGPLPPPVSRPRTLSRGPPRS
jgi:hypothetical protein